MSKKESKNKKESIVVIQKGTYDKIKKSGDIICKFKSGQIIRLTIPSGDKKP